MALQKQSAFEQSNFCSFDGDYALAFRALCGCQSTTVLGRTFRSVDENPRVEIRVLVDALGGVSSARRVVVFERISDF